ncbi:PREDICTED: uncharacterized protein LOC104802824 isoform X2 [Tarenaya hassleriana]|uniref:uncharacterized protein LOC104802824 isoform X2 n=1 Tax=Tarenaya hassleriana TaxID=28532 RepID=UPI00053C29A9|nr:PREDICTED: uncharacterized protein LOC104802824 isoform X2 [Tarenaya hassleriana]
MAGVTCRILFNLPSNLMCSAQRVYPPRCCSGSPEKKKTPAVVKWAVGGVTELIRLFSATDQNRLREASYRSKDEIITVRNSDDLMMILKSDYKNAYFVTGVFTSAIYADDCIFEDPTISFKGTELYERNLKLLVPFLEDPSIELKKMEKGDDGSERNYILATWKLRTYLKLPWKPVISINGSTVYELDRGFKIVRHVESWDVSAVEAIRQIFRSSSTLGT